MSKASDWDKVDRSVFQQCCGIEGLPCGHPYAIDGGSFAGCDLTRASGDSECSYSSSAAGGPCGGGSVSGGSVNGRVVTKGDEHGAPTMFLLAPTTTLTDRGGNEICHENGARVILVHDIVFLLLRL